MEHMPSFARRAATAAFISLLILALFLLVGYAANFFFLVFGGIIVAVVLSALGHFVSDKTSLSYSLSRAAGRIDWRYHLATIPGSESAGRRIGRLLTEGLR